MSPKLAAKLLATTLALSPIPFAATTAPAAAQTSISVSFGYFHDTLAPYGQWSHHPRWGDVWHPRQVEADFRPYSRGHWDYTDRFGWTWASDYEWGDVAFHYGRWVYDPYDGWLWVPGYVWSPAWVIMRSGGGYVGWFPMPPDDAFLAGDEVYRTNWDNWDRGYGYADWYGSSYGANWLATIGVFVDERHFADRDYNRYTAPRTQIVNIVNRTRNVTNYVTVNNYIVNRSVDRRAIERASGRQIAAVSEREVIKTNTPVEPVNTGRQVQQRERRDHGGDPKAPANARVVALPPQPAGTAERDRGRNQGPNAAQNGPNGGPQNGPNAGQNRGQDQQRGRNAGPAQAEQRGNAQADQQRAQVEQQRAQADQQRAERDRAQAEQRANTDRQRAQADQQRNADRQRTQAEQQRNADQQRAQADQRAKAEQQRNADQQRAQAEQRANADRAQADQRAQAEQRNADRQRAQVDQQRGAQADQQRAERDRAQADQRAQAEQRANANADRQRAQAGQRANVQPGAQQQPAENAQQQPTQEAQQAANQRTKRGERKKTQE